MAGRNNLEANILITGTVINSSGNQEIQIPGYHMLGTNANSTPVRVRSAAEVKSILGEYGRGDGVIEQVSRNLDVAMRRAQNDSTLGNLLTRFNGANAILTDLRDARMAVDNGSVMVDGKADSLAAIESRIAGIQQSTAALSAEIAAHPKAKDYLNEATSVIQLHSAELIATLTQLTHDDNSTVLRVVAEMLQRHYRALVASANGTARQVEALATAKPLTDNSEVSLRTGEIRRVHAGLHNLLQLAESSARVRWEEVNLRLLDGIKEVDLSVRSTAASPGDDLVLTVHNFRDDAARTRSMDLRMRVREFGFVRNITDSYMFFHRDGVGQEYRRRVAADSTEAAARVRTDRTAFEYRQVVPMNYEPALGVSLGWTYYRRPSPKLFSRIVRWVEPGAGINVSFPRFGSRTTTVSLSNATDSAAPLIHKVTDNRPQIGLSSGAVITMFDGAIQFSSGYSLAATSKRRYHALGFSFFEVAKRLAQAAGS